MNGGGNVSGGDERAPEEELRIAPQDDPKEELEELQGEAEAYRDMAALYEAALNNLRQQAA